MGITDLTPPWGFSTSPNLRGIKWKWQCKIDWPETLPIFVPRLKPSIFGSFFITSSLTFLIRSLQATSYSSVNSKKSFICLLGIIRQWYLETG